MRGDDEKDWRKEQSEVRTLQRTDTDIRCWRTLVILACISSILETENAALNIAFTPAIK